MAKLAGVLRIAFLTCMLCWLTPALGQRIMAPGPISTNTAPSLLPGPAVTQAPIHSYVPPAIGGSPLPPPTYSFPPGSSPGHTPFGAAPIGGTPTMDPYAMPGHTTSNVFSSDPSFSTWGGSNDLACYWDAAKQRFVEVSLDYTWMPGNGPEELGLHDADVAASFGIPFLYDPNSKLFITPGMAWQWWNGPSPSGPNSTDMPPRTYEAYLDTAWSPQIPQLPAISAELGFRIGVYSDFGRVDAESLRYQGSGMAVIGVSNSYRLKLGVMYLDRVRVKMLPAGGIIWTPPGGNVDFHLLFPNPKLAWRLKALGAVQTWAYLRGEYGGGSWDVRRDAGPREQVDYNDLRIAVGVEFMDPNAIAGRLEIGLAFERELYFGTSLDEFNPNPALLVGGSFSF